MRSSRARAAVAAVVACVALIPRAQAQQSGDGLPAGTFEGTSQVRIEGSDQAAAREKALSGALRDALETAVGVIAGGSELTEHYAQIERSVLTRSRSFMAGYQVTDEGEADGQYRVSVRARVATDALRRALATSREPAASDSADDDRSPPSPNAPGSGDETIARVELLGRLTAARYKAIRAFLERQVPGVRAVTVEAAAPGTLTLAVRGVFPAPGLGGYLGSASLGDFRLDVSTPDFGPTLQVVVEDAPPQR